jgi:CheY-like chemotaxis protein
MGFEVQVASDGLEALQWVKRRRFAAVIMDTHIPRLEGPDAFHLMRAIRPGQRIILLSSLPGSPAEDSTKAELMQKGAVAYLTKPVELDDLLEALGKALGKVLDVSMK